AAVTGIVRAHRGSVSVESVPGKGTRFCVALPPAASQADGEPENAEIELRGCGSVLVVDDEDLVRNMARLTLERCGYAVETASNGQSAIEIFAQSPSAFSAVLLDLTMPVMDGEEALHHLKGIQPNVAVVLSSGYNETEAFEKFQDRGACGFLQKPYTPAALA